MKEEYLKIKPDLIVGNKVPEGHQQLNRNNFKIPEHIPTEEEIQEHQKNKQIDKKQLEIHQQMMNKNNQKTQ
jgi:hypothetical protein